MSAKIRRQFKVCLIGDGFVGKTSIRRKYLKEGFKRSYIPTLGVDFAQKSLLFEGTPTNLVIWDIAGQVAFQNLRRRYYEGSSGIILLYAVNDRNSFDSASKWLVEAHGFMGKLPPLMIVGNKIDLRNSTPEQDIVTTEEGKAFADSVSQKLGARVVFIETSAKTGNNVDETFETLTRMMINVKEGPIKTAEPAVESAPGENDAVAATSETTATAETDTTQTPAATTTTTSEPTTTVETEESQTPATAEVKTPEPSSPTPQTPLASSEGSAVAPPKEVDPVTLLPPDSQHLKEEGIGKAMNELQMLRTQLKATEEELTAKLSQMETELLRLKNTVHVKRIMFEHLKGELKTTREEWANAYQEYQKTNKQRKEELSKKNREIEELRKKIEEIGAKVRTRVGDLDFKKMSEF